MMTWLLPLLTTLLGNIGGGIGEFFKKQSELQLAKLDLERQVVIEQYKMAATMAEYQAQASQAALGATGRGFKYFTFAMWFGPFMVGCIKADWSKAIFDNLNQMPQWYVESCMTIMFTIWGIQVASPVISSIFSNLGQYFADKREHKLEMKKVSNEEYKKAYFEALHRYKEVVTPLDVAIGNKVIDDLGEGRNYMR